MNAPFDDDPLNLDRVDQDIRINQLRNKIEDVTREEFVMGGDPNLAPDLKESFLEHVLAMEEAGFTRPFDVLRKNGVVLPSPDELDDASLPDVLWKVLRAAAEHGLVIYHTDHLNDRELYAYLWGDGLREEFMGFGMPGCGCCLDIIGSGSDEDITLGLRYYDDEKQRKRWAKQFPEFTIPRREKPPFDRDRHLPQG